ncbi:MAG TPA: hypothetical protein VI233_11395 [Puia sp.]
MIAREETAAFIHYTYKTNRKHGGEPILATQELEDLLSSPIVKNTIVNMSDCMILLDQGRYLHRIEDIQKLFGLSQQDVALLLSLNKSLQPGRNYKEIFIKLGTSHSRVYRLELSPEEYLLYTTKDTEKITVSEYTRKFGNIRKGISVLAADIRNGAVKLLLTFAFSALFLLLPQGRAHAQILDLIDAVLKKVLVSADLAVQKVQTQTLLLQGTQRELENTMHDNWLGEITGWVRQQEQLYNDYYRQLWQVKSVIGSYGRVKDLLQRQAQLIQECSQARTALKQDPHFSPAELAYFSSVYDRFLDESAGNIEQITLVLGNLLTRMDDASRLQAIDETAGRVDHSLASLHSFIQQTAQLSRQRARESGEIQTFKTLYNIH